MWQLFLDSTIFRISISNSCFEKNWLFNILIACCFTTCCFLKRALLRFTWVSCARVLLDFYVSCFAIQQLIFAALRHQFLEDCQIEMRFPYLLFKDSICEMKENWAEKKVWEGYWKEIQRAYVRRQHRKHINKMNVNDHKLKNVQTKAGEEQKVIINCVGKWKERVILLHQFLIWGVMKTLKQRTEIIE